MNTISAKKMKIKLISLTISTILLIFALLVKKVSFSIMKLPYLIVILLVASLLIIISLVIIITNKEFNEKFKYYFYQVLDFTQILVFTLAIIQLIFLFWFFPATVKMDSMTPTLYEKDNLIIKVGNSKIKRFDVVVIDTNNMETTLEPGDLIIKRVVGLPGDNFKYRNGKLILIKDGVETVVEEPFLLDENGNFKYGNRYSTYTPDFSFAYSCHNCDFDENMAIPDDYYFVLGDNRGNNYSYDSRSFGLVHRSNIVGTAKYRIKNIVKWETLKWE